MSYPGANHQNHHQPVGGYGGGFPQPQYNQYGPPGGGYQQPPGPPPGQGYQPGYGGAPGGVGFPQPQHYGGGQQQYQQQDSYQPSYNGGGGGGGFPHPSGPPSNYVPPPNMPYPQPGGGPPVQRYQQTNSQGPPQYQNLGVHTQPGAGHAGANMYSNCSGKRKALLVGINYTGTSNALAGCHNDVRNLSKFLMERHGYKQDDMVMLLDLPNANPRTLPTHANIIQAMQWLVKGAQPNDALFFHYSGHGGQAADVDGDEDDGSDETIYPLDFKQTGMIIDDHMHDIMVRNLPQGCRLTAIFDSCHSGSALDLPYIYSTQGVLKEPNMLKDVGGAGLTAVKSYMQGNMGGVFGALSGVGKKLLNSNNGNAERVKQAKSSMADVISWSGCKDDQTSADTSMAGKATGAMSFAFIAALTKYPQQSYLQLLNTIRDELKGKYDQKPQLSCSHELDVNLLFVL